MFKIMQLFGAVLLLVCAGCSSRPDPEFEAIPPIYRLSTELGGRDPIEVVNRSMYGVNEAVLHWGYRPLGYVWGSIFPQPVINSFNNFTDNVGFTVRMLSCFLQADFSGGGVELLRFLTNTTVGIAGFFEVADPWFGLERRDEDFGQAFAKWGIPPGCYLFVPLYGPANIRDGVGAVFDAYLDPKAYVYGGHAFAAFNRLHAGYRTFDNFRMSQPDGYEMLRDLSLQQRHMKINNLHYRRAGSPPPEVEGEETEAMPEHDAATLIAAQKSDRFIKATVLPLTDFVSAGAAPDSIRSIFFTEQSTSIWPYLSLWNNRFTRTRSVHRLRLLPGRPAVDCAFYEGDTEDKTAPLVVVLSGIGAHYSSPLSTAVAYLAHLGGHPSVVFTNTLHPQFLRGATEGFFSGYTVQDAYDLARLITLAVEDIKSRHGLEPESLILTGYSHGALHSLFITELFSGVLPLPIEKVVVVNPPVDIMYATGVADGYMRIGEAWSSEEAQARLTEAIAKYQSPHGIRSLPQIDEDTAKVIIGAMFRFTLRDALVELHRREGIAALDQRFRWGNRHRLYLEVNQLDFEWYLNEVLLPGYRAQYGRQGITREDLIHQSSMRYIADKLAADERVRVLHSIDDFLLSDEDTQFLTDTFGDRLTVFGQGGHLGSLSRPEVQELLAALLARKDGGDE